ncbi:MAG: hypothetical protein CMM00_00265 [Rhodopirellula sp.]|nr:hypothetical protein [Rhodopirellula sp.]
MLSLIRNVSLLVLVIATGALVATALPTLWGGHLGGATLRFHMMASGAVVVLLPVYAIARLLMRRLPATESVMEMGAFRTLLIFGIATIATMFVCMLPVASTDTMHELVELHGWAGLAMAAAIAAVVYTTFTREKTA